MKKVIIIDDEPLARSVVKEYLSNREDLELVAECNNGFEGVKAIQEHNPDLIFLDIQMPKINGFEMLELIEENPSVIFTTAFDEYAIKAFDVSAIDYLLKPFSKDRFDIAITKWLESNGNETKRISNEITNKQPEEQLRIVIKDGANIKIIPTEEVNYIESYDDYVKIHTDEKTYLKHKTMSYYEKALNQSEFVRIHRSYIINLKKLTRIEPFEKNNHRAVLTDGSSLSISRSSYPKVKEALGI
jgi:two-component system LytT family response regulator